jgi:hypothetical protein
MQSEFITKIYYYIIYFVTFIISQSLSIWGQYFTLKFKNLTNWEALKMALPFAWVDWVFLTYAIDIGNRYNLVTPTQNIFLLIIVQFTLVLLVNHYYLKQKVYFSEIVAFFIIIVAYGISLFNLVSKILNIPVPKNPNKEEEKEEKEENKKE